MRCFGQEITKHADKEKEASGQVVLPGTAPAPSSDATEVPEHILATCLEERHDVS